MPDQPNFPSDQQQPTVTPTVTPPSTPIVDNSQIPPSFPEVSDVPPMPPITNETPQEATNIKVEETPPPQPDIPPIITGSSSPKKGRGKVVAAILGILLLVGAVGVGVVLIGQQQLFNQKASCGGVGSPCSSDPECCSGLICSNGLCAPNVVPTPIPTPTPACYNGDCLHDCITCDKKTPSECGSICNIPTPTPPSPPCTGGTRGTGGNINSTITVTIDDKTACGSRCHDPGSCKIYVERFNCSSTNLPNGCQENGVILNPQASTCNSFGFNTSIICGTQQIDLTCKDNLGTYGSVGFLSENGQTNCSGPTSSPGPTSTPPGPTPTGTPSSAQCSSVKAYNLNWQPLSNSDLAFLKPGDKVRFTVSGTPAGQIDKARFVIYGGGADVLKPVAESGEVTQKKPGTDEYYYQFTIPAGVTSFNVTAQIHHLTLGWF